MQCNFIALQSSSMVVECQINKNYELVSKLKLQNCLLLSTQIYYVILELMNLFNQHPSLYFFYSSVNFILFSQLIQACILHSFFVITMLILVFYQFFQLIFLIFFILTRKLETLLPVITADATYQLLSILEIFQSSTVQSILVLSLKIIII